jgi:hypothetical protein
VRDNSLIETGCTHGGLVDFLMILYAAISPASAQEEEYDNTDYHSKNPSNNSHDPVTSLVSKKDA